MLILLPIFQSIKEELYLGKATIFFLCVGVCASACVTLQNQGLDDLIKINYAVPFKYSWMG